jgi:hypothetical protein
MSNPNQDCDHQQGAVLMMLVAVLMLVVLWLSYVFLADLTQKLKRQQAQDVSHLLAEAKENLLIFAESIPEIYAGAGSEKSPGFLLCPDMNALTHSMSGYSSGSCAWGTGNAIGRLPITKAAVGSTQYYHFWSGEKTSGISLWYAIADAYRYGASGASSVYGNTINPVYGGNLPIVSNLHLDGKAMVAVIIAAGEPLLNQNDRDQTQAALHQRHHFLESFQGMNGVASFISRPLSVATPFNDRVIGISQLDFNQRMKRYVCDQARHNQWCVMAESTCSGSCLSGSCLGSGACGFTDLPMSHWFKRFEWSDSLGNGAGMPRICAVLNGKVNGINASECP